MSNFNALNALNAMTSSEFTPAERLGFTSLFTKLVNKGLAKAEDKSEFFAQIEPLSHDDRTSLLAKHGWDVTIPPQGNNNCPGGWISNR